MPIKLWIQIVFVSFITVSCVISENANDIETQKVKDLLFQYVDGWKTMNEKQVLGVFVEDARIQPSSLTPIEGLNNMRYFWFPDDGSETIIHEYDLDIMSTEIMDTLAITTQTTFLEYEYKKGETNLGMKQNAIGTAVYRKQNDGSWKIWRLMWTDIESQPSQ